MNNDTIKSILDWFATAKPNPTNKDVCTQIGCHFEEVHEMWVALNKTSPFELSDTIQHIATMYKTAKADDEVLSAGRLASFINEKEVLDALCDQIVTALGVGYMLGFDMQGALAEVNRSNWSKFENDKPVFDKDGKIVEGKYYDEPELRGFIK